MKARRKIETKPFRFPKSFTFGVAASAPQIEGAWDADGKGPSIWDTFCRTIGAVANNDTLDTACDHYHRFRDDIRLMAELGVRNYRLSISWPRIIPDGDGPVNKKGLLFYHKLIDCLLSHRIRPWVNFYHYDLPQSLQDRKGGWLSRDIPLDFLRFCEIVVEEYADKVNRWITINEPWCLMLGYHAGHHAPGHKGTRQDANQVLHHGMLAHGYALQAVREYGRRGSQAGVVHNPTFSAPIIETPEHIAAAKEQSYRDTAPMMEPMINGRYPEWWLSQQGADAPRIEPGDLDIIGAKADFFGLNVYTGRIVRAGADGTPRPLPFSKGHHRATVAWLNVVPDIMYWAPRFAHEIYKPGMIQISENGCSFPDAIDEHGEIIDTHRIDFLRNHLLRLERLVREGYPVNAYFLWSIMDNFEWADGYDKTFGIVGIDRRTLARIPKASAAWYKEVLRTRMTV